ncbi:MAG: hypothetical protein Ct9H90mP14_2110 [Methanobacteriota archaeon]|nr:MAG: hypothetical protein Ct9H90mP14_2110 [Euryarchaeota archaeon]
MWDFSVAQEVYWDGRRPTSLWLIPFAFGPCMGFALPYLINHELFDEFSPLGGPVGISALLAIGLLAFLFPQDRTKNRDVGLESGLVCQFLFSPLHYSLSGLFQLFYIGLAGP